MCVLPLPQLPYQLNPPVHSHRSRSGICHQALSAIDILACRTRLSFLNARAALDALPRIIDIMSAELNWSCAECTKQTRETVDLLVGSTGLDEGYISGDVVRRVKERVQPRGWAERVERSWWDACASIGKFLGAGRVGGEVLMLLHLVVPVKVFEYSVVQGSKPMKSEFRRFRVEYCACTAEGMMRVRVSLLAFQTNMNASRT